MPTRRSPRCYSGSSSTRYSPPTSTDLFADFRSSEKIAMIDMGTWYERLSAAGVKLGEDYDHLIPSINPAA
jgi:hypothetical protein